MLKHKIKEHTLIIATVGLAFFYGVKTEAKEINTPKMSKAESKLISPESWGEKSQGISLSKQKDSLLCKWEGKNKKGSMKSKETFKVTPGKYIELGIEWKKGGNWNYGSAFNPIITFETVNGKRVGGGRIFDRLANTRKYSALPSHEFYSGTPTDKWTYYRNVFKVPPKAEMVRFSLVFMGNNMEFLVKKFWIKETLEPERAKFKRPVYNHITKRLTKAEIDKILTVRQKTEAKVKRIGDLNCVFVNGKKINPTIYKNGPVMGNLPEQLSRCATFGKAGFNIFTVMVYLGKRSYRTGRDSVWAGENKYDIGKLEQAVYDILMWNPDAYVMFEFIMSPYHEWTVNNPDEIYQNSKGEKGIMQSCRVRKFSKSPPEKDKNVYWIPSYYSEKYKNDVSKALKNIFAKFEKTLASKAVIGVYVNGGADGQWLDIFDGVAGEDADYSPAALKSFRKFLRQKYDNNQDALKEAWGNQRVSFDNVKMPLHDEVCVNKFFYGRRMVDFYEWLSIANTERQLEWCKIIKKVTNGRLLLGGYWHDGGMSAYPSSGHRSSKKMYESDAIDFFAMVPGYNESREAGQSVRFHAYNGSLLLHQKLLITEMDVRNGQIPHWSYWGMKDYLKTHNAHTFYNKVLRFVGFSKAMGGTFHAYDMDGGWWDTPEAVATWEKACAIAAKATPQPMTDDRIAVFVDEKSAFHMSLHGNYRLFAYSVKEHASTALWRSGIRFDYYLLEDSLNPEFKAPKVLMFLDASTMTPAQAGEIHKKYANSGRVIVWFWAPGIFAPGGTENISKITGFKLVEAPKAMSRQLYVAHQNDPLLKGVKGFQNYIYRWGIRLGPLWKVDDPAAKKLANYYRTNIPGMAVKRYKEHTEIYIGQPGALSPQLCRNIAKEAKLTPMLETDDVSRYGAGLFTVSAAKSGEKTVYLSSKKSSVKSLTSEKVRERKKKTFKYSQKAHDTAIFSIIEK